MRKLFCIILCIPLLAIAGTDMIPLEIADVSTSAVPSTVSAVQFVDGYVVSVELCWETANTGDVCIVAEDSFCGNEVVIYSNAAFSSSDPIYPRVPVQDTGGVNLGVATNGYEPAYLVMEKLQLKATSASETNKTLKARVNLWN